MEVFGGNQLILLYRTWNPGEEESCRCGVLFKYPVLFSQLVHGLHIHRELPARRHADCGLKDKLGENSNTIPCIDEGVQKSN